MIKPKYPRRASEQQWMVHNRVKKIKELGGKSCTTAKAVDFVAKDYRVCHSYIDRCLEMVAREMSDRKRNPMPDLPKAVRAV